MHASLSKIEIIIAQSPVAALMQRHGRVADMQLYKVLADCMQIAEICIRVPKERAVLDGLIKKLPVLEGQARHWIERDSDIWQRVCRFMFHGERHNANTNRYAHCIREAANCGVKSNALIDELSAGGINKFYLRRPSQRENRNVETRCLRLDQIVTHTSRATFTLTLKRNGEGFYDVVNAENATARKP